MIFVESPVNERERLDYLRNLGILDTPVEERFERVTRVLCRALNVPIAGISLLDEDRLWFKSIQGLAVTEIPREQALCGQTLLDDKLLVVEDTTLDKRFANNPLVTGKQHIRFYAGQPLTVANGLRVGTLCVLDTKSRAMSLEEREILADMAHIVEAELSSIALSMEQRKLIKELDQDEKEARIDPLTRFWNRKGILNLLHRDWGFAVRHSLPVGAAFVEFKDLKRIRTLYGPEFADEVLRTVSRRLITSLRSYDAVGRWTSNTFLMVLPGCPKNGLESVLNRTLAEIERTGIESPGGTLHLRPIFGATCMIPQREDTLEQLLVKLDEALEEAQADLTEKVRIAS